MSRTVLLKGIAAFGVLALIASGCSGKVEGPSPGSQAQTVQLPKIEPRIITESRTAQPFTLVDQDGKRFTYNAANSDATMLFFGYTFCPDICPMSLAEYRRVIDALGAEADRVQFLFVSVDPERDSPERVKGYVSKFSPRITGLTGTSAEIERVARAYGIEYRKQELKESQAGYLVAHTASIYLIDAAGQFRVEFPLGTAPSSMVTEVQGILHQAPVARIRVEEPWVRAAAAGHEGQHGSAVHGATSALYMRLKNPGPEPDRLIGVKTESATAAEIHESRVTDGLMQMGPVTEGLVIPAGGEVALRPASYHVMLMGLKHELVAGQKQRFILLFEKAGEIAVEAEVREP